MFVAVTTTLVKKMITIICQKLSAFVCGNASSS
jgi:hypothetical protein